MSIRRSLALRIFNAVIRFAPVGASEWAKGMLCEIDFIESDWTALSWALGSTRILFTHPEIQLAQPRAVPWPVEDLARKVRRRTVFGYTLASSMILTFGCLFYVASTSVQRIGCCLGIAAMFYIWGQLYALRVRHQWVESASLAGAAYRTELERQRDFYRGLWFWSRISIVVIGFALFCIGGVVVHPESLRGYAAFAIFLVTMLFMAVWLNLRETRMYQAQIERLDSPPPQANHFE